MIPSLTIKRIVLTCFIIAAMSMQSFSLKASSFPHDETTVSGPVISADTTSVDFGLIDGEERVSHIFRITNTGDEPLMIMSVYSDCGCTTSDYSKDPVAPGESTELRVTFNPKGRPAGYFTKLVRIRSNASMKPFRIYVKGRIRSRK